MIHVVYTQLLRLENFNPLTLCADVIYIRYSDTLVKTLEFRCIYKTRGSDADDSSEKYRKTIRRLAEATLYNLYTDTKLRNSFAVFCLDSLSLFDAREKFALSLSCN